MTSGDALRSARKLAALWGGQAGNYLLTILVVPHLIRALGLEAYGAFVLLQSTLLFGTVLIEYGFPVVANRRAAMLDGSSSGLRMLASSVALLRVLLWILACAMLFIGATWFDKGQRTDWIALGLGAIGLLGTALFPQWILVGLGKAIQVGWLILVWRTVGVVCILLFVGDSRDFAVAAAFTYLPNLGMAAHARIWLRRRTGPWEPPPRKMLGDIAMEGGSIFLATLGTMLYSTWNLVHLGRSGTMEAIGAYGAAEKVVRVVAGAAAPVVQAVLPRFAARDPSSGRTGPSWARIDLAIACSFLAGGAASVLLMTASGSIAHFLSGSNQTEIATNLFRLSPVLFLVLPGLVVSHLALLARGDARFWMILTLAVGGVNLLALPFATSRFGPIGGTLVSTYSCEAIVLAACLVRHLRNLRKAGP